MTVVVSARTRMAHVSRPSGLLTQTHGNDYSFMVAAAATARHAAVERRARGALLFVPEPSRRAEQGLRRRLCVPKPRPHGPQWACAPRYYYRNVQARDRWSACRGPGAARKALLGFIAPPPLPNVQWYWHQAPAFAFGAGSARPKASRVSPRAAGPAPRRKHSTGVRPRNGCPAQKCPRSTLEGKFC